MKALITCLSIIHLMVIAQTAGAAVLENPKQGANLSSIGFISGWKCHATNITITINDGEHLPVAMHQDRADLLEICGSARHGFIMQINWAWPTISDGEHVVVAYDKGVEFDRVTFTVGTLGEEFVSGVEQRKVIADFPSPNEYTVMEWNESTQHFEVLSVLGGEPKNKYDPTFWNQFNSAFTLRIWEDELLYEEVPNVDQCQAGRLTDLAKNRALEAVNHIRALVGLSPLKYSALYDRQMQLASLLKNTSVGYPPPSSKCYTEEGGEGIMTSLFSSLSHPNASNKRKNADPVGGIINIAHDYSSHGHVGLRRLILNPFANYFSYGRAGNYALLKVYGFSKEPVQTPQINVDFVAHPYGTYPRALLKSGATSIWSFSVIPDKRNPSNSRGDFFQDATITVTDVSNDINLPIYNRFISNLTYGVPNALTWRVEGWRFATLYRVTIENVTLKNGTTRDYSYSVFIK